MTFYTITPPAVEPVTVAEMKTHLRVDATNVEPDPYDPPSAALVSPAAAGNLSAGVYRYKVTFVTADGETLASPSSSPVTVAAPGTNGRVQLSDIMTGGSVVTARKIYRTTAGGSSYHLLTTLNDNTTTDYTDNTADNALGAGEPATNSTGDGEIQRLIRLARQKVETDTGLCLITQTLERRTRDLCLRDGVMVIKRRPMQSLTSISYVSSGTTQTMAAEAYEVALGGTGNYPRVGITSSGSWPSVDAGLDKVAVRAVYGFGDNPADVPEELRHAMMLLAGHYYNNREAVNPAGQLTTTPMGYKALIASWCSLGSL